MNIKNPHHKRTTVFTSLRKLLNNMEDLSKLSLIDQINGLKSRKFSSMELTEFYLKKIDQEKALNSFISLNENALKEAKNLMKKLPKIKIQA